MYSTMRSPLVMSRVAKTPRPWMRERRTTMGLVGGARTLAVFVAGMAGGGSFLY
jgi:hypothetical protein